MPARPLPDRFKVAFSFAGEQRELVQAIAEAVEVRLGLGSVFYDHWYEHLLAGADADLKLQSIYGKGSDLVVVCVSAPYGDKPWTRIEHAAIRDRAMRASAAKDPSGHDAILPIRVGEGEVPGILRNTIVPDCRSRSPEATADLICERLGLVLVDPGLAARTAPPPTRAHRPVPHEHTLTVRRDGDALAADWDRGDPFPLKLPLDKNDLDALAWYLERYIEFPGAGDRQRAQALERQFTDWGRALWQAIFPGGAQNQTYTGIRDRLDRGQRVLLTLASDCPAFLIRPWEMLRDPRGPLALRGLTIRRRPIQRTGPEPESELALPLRLLLIVSRPADTGFIDPRTSTRPVLDALAALASAEPPQVAVDFCEPPTFAELERRLAAARARGTPYAIVHFDGHGQYYPETGVGALCFEHEDRTTELIEGRRLGDTLSRFQVPLVLLEACRGAQVSDRPIFGAVAPALLQSGVGSVVAFSHSVHVAAATIACARLYRELVAGATVGESLEGARAALHADRKRWLTLGPDPETVNLHDWPILQLYQGATDPALVPLGSVAPLDLSAPPPDEPRLPGFPPAPRYRFHGRARELLDLERALLVHPAVLLHAGGGMGKTALAREAAHWWRRTGRFPQALFHSFEQGAGAEAVVRLIGEQLGDEGFASLSPGDQWAQAVQLYRRSPVLLVWDNYESVLPAFSNPVGSAARTEPRVNTAAEGPHSGPYDAERAADLEHLYRDLTEGHPRGRLLVTCRPQETGLAGIRELHLAGLARPDALHLLRGIVEVKQIDLERPGWERAEIDALLERLEDHPLSIELVAPHLKTLAPATVRDELAARIGQFQDSRHPEGRNRSLLASLDFSRGRLSPPSRAALDWLGWFEGGMFERFLLDFSQIPESDWSAIRAELTATALVRVEDLPGFNTPYLKLHPTLADAAAPDLGDGERVGRFVEVYVRVAVTIDETLRGSQPAAGMALAGLEQSNLRRAIALAFGSGWHREGGELAWTLGSYLERAGRLRERDRLLDWVRGRMPTDRLDRAACGAIRQHAWSLFERGQAEQAMDAVLDLERRLGDGALEDGDPAFQLALACLFRGRILDHSGRPDLSLEPLEQSIAAFRVLGDAGRPNLGAALGDLGNALMALGRHDRALAVADEALEIARALGRDREVAAGLGQTATILRQSGRNAEAESRYRAAREAAERVGDLGLQGAFLQHLGALQLQTGRTAESAETLRRALRRFQQSGDRVGEMLTYNHLGSVERMLGRLDPAEAWYRRSLELAQGPGGEPIDRHHIGTIRQNLGILYQIRAESLLQSAAESPGGAASLAAERDRLLAAALVEIEASLGVKQEMGNRLGAASSHFQLGVLHRLRGDLDRAESESHRALAIYEPLNHPDKWKIYVGLAEIAHARGDSVAAADWQAKSDAKRAEQERLAAGPDPSPDPNKAGGAQDRALMQSLVSLAQSVHRTRTAGRPPEPDTAEALAQLAQAPVPLCGLAAFLQAVAAGANPSPPPGLPEPLAQLAAALLAAFA